MAICRLIDSLNMCKQCANLTRFHPCHLPADTTGHFHRREALPPRVSTGLREASTLLPSVRWRSGASVWLRFSHTYTGRARGQQFSPEGHPQLDLGMHPKEEGGSPLLNERKRLLKGHYHKPQVCCSLTSNVIGKKCLFDQTCSYSNNAVSHGRPSWMNFF